MLNTLINKLKQRLNDYSATKVYKLNNYPKEVVGSILVAISLVEEARLNRTKIQKVDRYLFEASYQVSRLFENPDISDIAVLYEEFVEIVKNRYF